MNTALRSKRTVVAALSALAVVLVVVLVFFVVRRPAAGTPGPSQSVPAVTGTPNLAPADLQQRIVDILTQMHQKAFNPTALPPKNSGGLSGGLFVNWYAGWDGSLATAPDNTNFQSNGRTDSELGLAVRHDEFTDLIYLRDLLGYRAAHPSDHAFDTDIARMEPVVRSDFKSYNYYKCSLYGELEDLARFEPGGGWGAMADTYVRAVFAKYYDSARQTVVGGANGSYRVDFAIECAVAFTDAGNRLHDSSMTAAGPVIAQHLVDDAIDPSTHLLPLQMTANLGARDTLVQRQVKMGEEAQSLDAFLSMYEMTHRQAYLTQVIDAVSWLFASSLHDQQHGGFYFAVNTDGSGLESAYKESRQGWMLPLLEHLERLEPGHWTAQINEMLSVVKDNLWGAGGDGYVYRTTPDFQVYRTHAGAGRAIVAEDWVTSEAMDIACQSLEEYAAGD